MSSAVHREHVPLCGITVVLKREIIGVPAVARVLLSDRDHLGRDDNDLVPLCRPSEKVLSGGWSGTLNILNHDEKLFAPDCGELFSLGTQQPRSRPGLHDEAFVVVLPSGVGHSQTLSAQVDTLVRSRSEMPFFAPCGLYRKESLIRLSLMEHPPGGTVDLKVKDGETGKTNLLKAVPMTEENRRELREEGNTSQEPRP